MNELYQFLSSYTEPITFKTILLSLLLAFGLSQAIAATYVWTFKGMSYSSSFVLTLAMGGVIACMLMLSINNSIAAGLGIAGSLAIIRFRTALRDPRDMIFVFASMAAGISAGLRVHLAALVGTLLFCISVYLLTKVEFGTQQKFDGLLRFRLPSHASEDAVAHIIKRYTNSFVLVSMREAGQGKYLERSYQVQLPDPNYRAELMRDLEDVDEIQAVSLLLQDPTVEI